MKPPKPLKRAKAGFIPVHHPLLSSSPERPVFPFIAKKQPSFASPTAPRGGRRLRVGPEQGLDIEAVRNFVIVNERT
jgi:hypothetical protein